MFNLIKSDLFKIRKSMGVKILFIISIVAAVAMTIVSNGIATGNMGTESMGIGSLFADIQMMSLFGSVLSGIFICNDFDSKTINDAISSGYSRTAIVISKTITFMIITFFLMLPYVAAAFIALGSGIEFKAFIPSVFLQIMASGKALDGAVILKSIAIMATMFIVYASQSVMFIFFGFTFRKPAVAIAVGYIMALIVAKLNSIEAVVKFMKYTPLGYEFTKFTLDAEAGVFGKGIVISVIFVVVITFITSAVFRKSEIK